MARLPYKNPETLPPEAREALAAIPDLNIFRMLAHADSALVPYLRFGGTLLSGLELNPELRELAILLVAKRTGAEYEWIQHVGIARAIGVSERQIAAVDRNELRSEDLSEQAQVLLEFTSQVIDTPRVNDQAFAAAAELFPARQIIETLMVIGNYQMLARLMTTLDLDLDEAISDEVVNDAKKRL